MSESSNELKALLVGRAPVLALAPMQDITDLPFWRLLATYGGADVYFTEYFRVHPASRLERHILKSITENPTGMVVLSVDAAGTNVDVHLSRLHLPWNGYCVDYGVRDAVVDCAVKYLPEPNIRTLIGKFQEDAYKETDEYAKRHWLHLVESLARQIRDANLFEMTRIATWGKLSTAACVDIAEVYLERGEARTAISWLEKIPENETFQCRERDRLPLVIHGQLGQTEVLHAAEIEFWEPNQIEVEGLVTHIVSLSEFTVRSQVVSTNSDTVFEGGASGNIALGVKLEVKGVPVDTARSILVADKVSFEQE